jgi:serine/threonine protein kinase
LNGSPASSGKRAPWPALNHPHIVTLYSVEESGGTTFLTMELVEGEPLVACIPERGLPFERLLPIGSALADALAAAHEKGIVHRDLKPANVMLTPVASRCSTSVSRRTCARPIGPRWT